MRGEGTVATRPPMAAGRSSGGDDSWSVIKRLYKRYEEDAGRVVEDPRFREEFLREYAGIRDDIVREMTSLARETKEVPPQEAYRNLLVRAATFGMELGAAIAVHAYFATTPSPEPPDGPVENRVAWAVRSAEAAMPKLMERLGSDRDFRESSKKRNQENKVMLAGLLDQALANPPRDLPDYEKIVTLAFETTLGAGMLLGALTVFDKTSAEAGTLYL